MDAPPAELDVAEVLYYAFLKAEHRETGVVTHCIGASLMGPVPAIAVCQYSGRRGAYLFFCDNGWQVIQDDVYASVAEALDGAREQYQGLTDSDWKALR